MTYEFKTVPKPWQERGYHASRDMITYAYAMDPGMGKTKLALDVAGYNFDKGKIDTLLVLAPNGVHEVWVEEAAKHLNVPYEGAAYRSGLVNRPFLAVLASKRDTLKVIAVNIEAMSSPSGVALVKKLMKGRRVMMVVDESQKIRTPSAKRTRSIWHLGEGAVMRRICSGTVIIRGPENLYAQYRFLHPAIIGCSTYTEFKSTYCIEAGPFHEIVGYRHQEMLLEKIAKRTFFAYESEMGLDDPVVSDRPVALSKEQRRLYDQFRDAFLAELQSGAIVEAPLAINRLQKFQQVVAGHVRLDDASWEAVPCPRLDDAVDVAQNAPSKILVWGQWQPDIIQLAARFKKAGIESVTYFGLNSPGKNRENLARFKEDSSVHAFIATQSSGGAGLTINEAKHTLNYSHTFNTEHAWQARKRNHRLGQEHIIHVTNLIAKGTVDVKTLKSQNTKWDLASLLRNPKLLAAQMEKWLEGSE